MKNSIAILALLFLMQQGLGQTPHLSGEVIISIQSGTIDADLKLSNLPETDNYSLLLNTGLNVQYFRDSGDSFNYYFKRVYDAEVYEEGFQYYFPSSDKKSQYLPNAFLVRYTGKFPIFNDTLRAYDWGDWKGNIAFDGQVLRAAEQTGWYPILLNKKTGVMHLNYTYDVTISCADCQSIYFNGSAPVKGPQSTFQSEIPVPLMIFAGNFEFSHKGNVYFIHSGLRSEKQETLVGLTDRIIRFYEDKLGIPFGSSSLAFLNTTPVSKNNAWMFVTYPTIAVVGGSGYTLRERFDPETFQLRNESFTATIAHELGHYYIGNHFRPNSTLFWFFAEGLTDYLSPHAVRHFSGEEFFGKRISVYRENVARFEPIPLNKVSRAGEIGEMYRYRYVPLMLLAVEKEIGEEAMWAWMKEVINSDGQVTDYDFLLSSFSRAGIPQDTIDFLVRQYIESENAKQHILDRL